MASTNLWADVRVGDEVIAREGWEGTVVEVDPPPTDDLSGRWVWVKGFGDGITRGYLPGDLAIVRKRQRWHRGRLETIAAVKP